MLPLGYATVGRGKLYSVSLRYKVPFFTAEDNDKFSVTFDHFDAEKNPVTDLGQQV